jgi:UDP-N-acetyl-D-galactosamine dehydrogenase
MDEETLDTVASVYALIITAGVYRASSIKVAEAAKVMENSQRDINIAFINEMAMVFDRIGIDTNDVIDAMNTKWNALGFRPGLVGGHCIGVDPYYFIYEAEKLGYHSQIVLSGRKVNDGMGIFVADAAIKKMILAGKTVKSARVAIFGMTFKENCPDVRNSKVYDIIQRLREYGVDPLVIDPVADPEETQSVYGITLTPISAIFGADCLIFAVAHQQFRDLTWAQIDQCFEGCPARCRVLLDVKGMFRPDDLKSRGYAWWRL